MAKHKSHADMMTAWQTPPGQLPLDVAARRAQFSIGDTVQHVNSKRRGVVSAVRPQRDGSVEYDVAVDLEECSWSSWRVHAPDAD